MMLKKTALALTLGLGLVAGANATIAEDKSITIAAPTIIPHIYEGSFEHSVGTFTDTILFKVTDLFSLGGAVFNSPNKDKSISFTSVELYLETGATDTLIPMTLTGTDKYLSGYDTFTMSGDFYFLVKGTADGAKGGKYTWSVNTEALPVPEPETYAMLLAGLGLMGTIARRRNKSKAN